MRGSAAVLAVLAATLGGAAREDSAQEQKPAAEKQPAAAQASEAAKGPNTGRVSINAGVDWTSAYFFRGIKQETEDLILQPYGEVGLKLVDQAGALTALSLTAASGTASRRAPPAPTARPPRIPRSGTSSTATSASPPSSGRTSRRTRSTPPTRAPTTRSARSRRWRWGWPTTTRSSSAPSPSTRAFLVAFELDGQADAGADKGVYAQIGIAPGYTFLADSTYPVAVSVPLAFIPPDFGKWLIKAGVTVLYLDDALKTINDGDRAQVIGTLGLAFTY